MTMMTPYGVIGWEELKDTPGLRIPPQSGHLTKYQLHIITCMYYPPPEMHEDTSLIRTHFIGPRVSILERFHCIYPLK